MILALTVKILNQSVWNFCMKKGGTLYLMLSIDNPIESQSFLEFNISKWYDTNHKQTY